MKKKTKLTKQEKEIEDALMAGRFIDIEKDELEEISQAIASRKKDALKQNFFKKQKNIK